MQARKISSLLLTGICILELSIISCNPPKDDRSGENANSGNSTNIDTSLNGLTGVVEKNPPVMDGNYVTKYPSGIVKMKGFYISGKRDGEWVSFFESGQKQSEGFFKNGLRDGKATVYYPNGKVYYQGFYKDGKEVGKWLFFDQNGTQVNEKDYDKSN